MRTKYGVETIGEYMFWASRGIKVLPVWWPPAILQEVVKLATEYRPPT